MSTTTPDTTARAMTPLAWTALGVVYIVWGSTYLAIDIVIESAPPMMSGGVRFLLAALLLGTFLAVRHGPGVLKVSRRQLGSAALIGILLLTGGNGMVAVAEQHISTGLAALMVASVPLWLVVFRMASGNRPPVTTLAGVAAGFTGVALLSVLSGGGSGSTQGIVVILLASLSWSVGSFVSGRLTLPANNFVTSVYEMAAGGGALLVVGLGRGERMHPAELTTSSWLALGYLVTFGSLLAFTSYSWLLQHAPITLVGTYAYVNPAVAIALGALLHNESVTLTTMVGGAIIIVGVSLVVSTERKSAPARAPEPEPVLTSQRAES